MQRDCEPDLSGVAVSTLCAEIALRICANDKCGVGAALGFVGCAEWTAQHLTPMQRAALADRLRDAADGLEVPALREHAPARE